MSQAALRPAGSRFDAERVRAEFPILRRTQRGRPLVYLDSAATAQKPRAVIDAVSRFYEESYASVHRGAPDASRYTTRSMVVSNP